MDNLVDDRKEIGELGRDLFKSWKKDYNKRISTEGKTRNWYKYLNRNKHGEADCQLVTACNAYYHLTGKPIDQNSDFYEKMRINSLCCAGSCINIEKAWEMLGIEEDSRFKSHEKHYLLKGNNFFEINVWHKYFGFHSIAAINYSKQCDALRVTNFRHVASNNGWIFEEDLYPHLNDMNKDWTFRTFKLKT